jgi:hypothetical protein
VLTLIKREPAVLIGLLASVLVVVQQVVAGSLTWSAAVPVVVGIVTRFFVSPATS